MNWVVGITLLIIIIYLVVHQLKRKKYLVLKEFYKSEWGNPKKDEYYNFDLINQYFKNSTNKKNAYHIISDQTNSDLDIHDLFKYIDRTSSKIGQQYLYFKLRVIEQKDKLLKFDLLTHVFEENEKIRLDCQLNLSKLNEHSSYDLEKLINDDVIKKPSYQKFLIPLALGYIISIFLGFFHPLFFITLLPIFMVNLVLHYKTKDYINYYLSAVSQLSISLSVAEKIASYSEIENHFTDLSFIKRVKEIRLKIKFISFEKLLDNGFAFAFWLLFELIKIQFNFEAIVFYSFIDDIVKKRKSIDSLYKFLGEVDSAISVASLKHENKLICKPTFVENKELNIIGVNHPLIDNCISNEIQLKGKSLLLTGSNMSGKSTFIRTIALNSITSQTINIAFAEKFSIPFYKVYSSIRITDNLTEDTSYYLKEVLVIKKLIEISNESYPCLFVLDEIFKGTNTSERVSGGKAILTYLNKRNHFVLVSTHDIELTQLLKNKDFEMYHFSEKIINNKLFFDHKLKIGKLKTKNAIKILNLYGYPKEIIIDSKKTEKENFG